MAKLSHNDNPAEIDSFNQSAFIDQIAEVIQHCEPPKGIALNGYWGTGKTSCLGLLKEKLGDSVVPIWFEAWRYQNEASPIIALLHLIREQFSFRSKVLVESEKLTSVMFLGILSAFDETIKLATGGVFSPKFGDLPKIGEDYEKSHYHTSLVTNDIRRVLEQAIQNILDGSYGTESKKKLVIFIDDLDRCNPETALKLLEGIKVYLNLKNCVLVFAIDQRQIEQALNKALALDHANGEFQAREYLEKICQDIYHLPLPDASKKAEYLVRLLNSLDLVSGLNDADKIALELEHRVNIKLVVETFDCLPANPRKIKALANRISVILRKQEVTTHLNQLEKLRKIGGFPAVPFGYALLVACAIIYTFHRELNEHLNKTPNFINGVILFAKGSQGDQAIQTLMKGIQPSFDGSGQLPVNPSDSHVFRLHQLLIAVDTITQDEIKPFLGI